MHDPAFNPPPVEGKKGGQGKADYWRQLPFPLEVALQGGENPSGVLGNGIEKYVQQ